jgi:hypothetical protein
MAIAVPQPVEAQHKKTLRDLIAGREVPHDVAYAAIRWLRADATVVSTSGGGVRLRVPVMPRSATDLRGGTR